MKVKMNYLPVIEKHLPTNFNQHFQRHGVKKKMVKKKEEKKMVLEEGGGCCITEYPLICLGLQLISVNTHKKV